MPQPTKGPRLGGSPAHQRLILANLATQLFEHQRITTTEAKARRLRPYAERLITKAKLHEMGLSLKDSAPGFDPSAALAAYGDDDDDAFIEDESY